MSVTSTRFQSEKAPCGRVVDGEHYQDQDDEALVTDEVDYEVDGNFNDWIPRNGTFVGLDFPRTISWGIDGRGRRWLRVATDIEVEFRR